MQILQSVVLHDDFGMCCFGLRKGLCRCPERLLSPSHTNHFARWRKSHCMAEVFPSILCRCCMVVSCGFRVMSSDIHECTVMYAPLSCFHEFPGQGGAVLPYRQSVVDFWRVLLYSEAIPLKSLKNISVVPLCQIKYVILSANERIRTAKDKATL